MKEFLANVNFAICYRPSVSRMSSVCNARAPYGTQAIEIFGNISTLTST